MWNDTLYEPASAYPSAQRCGSSIIRWQSNGRVVALRRLCTTGNPMVRFGTKWLSITSMCSQSAAPSTARASSARWARSAARMLGATTSDGAVTRSVYEPGPDLAEPAVARGIGGRPLWSLMNASGTVRRRIALLGAAVLLLAGAAASALATVLPTPLRIVGAVLGGTGVVVVVVAERLLDRLVPLRREASLPSVAGQDAWNLPMPAPGFAGRDAEIARLRALLDPAGAPAVVALYGMGGVGKTTLAVHYAYRDPSPIGWLITSTDRRSLVAGLAQLAERLGVAGNEQEAAARAALAALADRDGWLLVYDNARDPADHAGRVRAADPRPASPRRRGPGLGEPAAQLPRARLERGGGPAAAPAGLPRADRGAARPRPGGSGGAVPHVCRPPAAQRDVRGTAGDLAGAPRRAGPGSRPRARAGGGSRGRAAHHAHPVAPACPAGEVVAPLDPPGAPRPDRVLAGGPVGPHRHGAARRRVPHDRAHGRAVGPPRRPAAARLRRAGARRRRAATGRRPAVRARVLPQRPGRGRRGPGAAVGSAREPAARARAGAPRHARRREQPGRDARPARRPPGRPGPAPAHARRPAAAPRARAPGHPGLGQQPGQRATNTRRSGHRARPARGHARRAPARARAGPPGHAQLDRQPRQRAARARRVDRRPRPAARHGRGQPALTCCGRRSTPAAGCWATSTWRPWPGSAAWPTCWSGSGWSGSARPAQNSQEHSVGAVPVRPELDRRAVVQARHAGRHQRPGVKLLHSGRCAPHGLAHAHPGLDQMRRARHVGHDAAGADRPQGRAEQAGLAAGSGAQVQPPLVGTAIERYLGQRRRHELAALVLNVRPTFGHRAQLARGASGEVDGVLAERSGHATGLVGQLGRRAPARSRAQVHRCRLVVGDQRPLGLLEAAQRVGEGPHDPLWMRVRQRQPGHRIAAGRGQRGEPGVPVTLADPAQDGVGA